MHPISHLLSSQTQFSPYVRPPHGPTHLQNKALHLREEQEGWVAVQWLWSHPVHEASAVSPTLYSGKRRTR